ncbi:hypothetical protein HYPSUDRAFT_47665 [Hypholoma sublateritium FD-334 SS-4]|uniref:Uncharacterized protein n=1 Tax=Hypholoma sublateritium (strain FD-334 SS-4) TaxID=945553 RepID=A0A0D2NHN4_HYPSF|nr:hypothetical protein HYPSUDRAFT_47665 [Hypholoma sublateritium FD-334 SS-4]
MCSEVNPFQEIFGMTVGFSPCVAYTSVFVLLFWLSSQNGRLSPMQIPCNVTILCAVKLSSPLFTTTWCAWLRTQIMWSSLNTAQFTGMTSCSQ